MRSLCRGGIFCVTHHDCRFPQGDEQEPVEKEWPPTALEADPAGDVELCQGGGTIGKEDLQG